MPERAGATGPTEAAGDDRMTLSRRYAAGAGGTRGLLLTVLGEFVLPTGRPTPTSAFIDVLGRLGVEEKASRMTLMRAAADGWLTSKRAGRYTSWQLSPAAEQFLTFGAERIYGFTAAQLEWDRRWVLVLARAPESNRAGRHLLRTRLGWAGFGSPEAGVWISTHLDRVKEAERVLEEAGVHREAKVFIAEYVAGADLDTMVREAWDLDAVEAAYEGFLADFGRQPSPDPLVRLAQLVHAWRRFPLVDPALPKQLLPARWSGVRAASLFHRQRTRWKPAATKEWDRITAGAGDD